MKAIGFDVGGTFIDFILYDSDSSTSWVLKVSSGADPSEHVEAGIRELCELAGTTPCEVGLLVHGTTIATNALLEYDGARTGLITTEGFRDILHIGRHQRPQNYSIQQDIPWQARPIVRRVHRLPVPERLIPPAGEVLVPLDEAAVRAAARALRADGVEAVAVCFLFSYLNPDHEQRAAAIVQEELPGAFVCTSYEVVPQFREFERFTTTAINAFIGPRVREYLEALEGRIASARVGGGLHLMQSNGGTATPAQAVRRPVTLLLSGPVGGIIGGVWCASERPFRHLATIDVGGTSADIGIVAGQGLVEARARETWIAGYPLLLPMIDIHTIGAGGGSIASIDHAGAPHVGPRSAGAVPGPACYGRGGIEPTVTDANVVLGRLPAALAGGLALDADRAREAIAGFAERLGVPLDEAATGIVEIMNENMAAALRLKTIERGLDPREFVLSAFGGAGPLHAVELARLLRIPDVLIPPNPGVTSAAGLLASDLRYDVVQSVIRRLSAVEPESMDAMFRSHEQTLQDQLAADGCDADKVDITWAADLRYRGQGYELNVPIDERPFSAETATRMRVAFDAAHRGEFGHDFPEYEVEIVNIRLTAVGRLLDLQHQRVASGSLEDASLGRHPVAFRIGGQIQWLETSVYDREQLPVGDQIRGPAIVTQLDSTTLVPDDAVFARDEVGNLHISLVPQ